MSGSGPPPGDTRPAQPQTDTAQVGTIEEDVASKPDGALVQAQPRRSSLGIVAIKDTGAKVRGSIMETTRASIASIASAQHMNSHDEQARLLQAIQRTPGARASIVSNASKSNISKGSTRKSGVNFSFDEEEDARRHSIEPDASPDAAAGPADGSSGNAPVAKQRTLEPSTTLKSLSPDQTATYSKARKTMLFIITSSQFDGFFGAVVGANAIVMALESELPEKEETWKILDEAFLYCYTVELLCRIFALRSMVFHGPANMLDVTIVIAGWIQFIVGKVVGNVDELGAVNALKVLRALRVIRCVRMLTFFDGLWFAVQSFFYCLKPLLWVCLFIFVILFIFAMFAVEMIGSSQEFDDLENQVLYARTVICIVTLFQVMTLDEWREMIQPICDAQVWTYFFFFFYIAISALALMNLVTAVVVENSMRRLQDDEEYRTMASDKEREAEKQKIQALLTFFGDGGEKADEHVVKPDALLGARKAWSCLDNVLDKLELTDVEDVQRLFELLDVDGNGELSLSEVLDGVLQLRTVSEDKYKSALIKALPSKDAKFEILERFCDQMPEACTRQIQCVEQRVVSIEEALGLKEKPKPVLETQNSTTLSQTMSQARLPRRKTERVKSNETENRRTLAGAAFRNLLDSHEATSSTPSAPLGSTSQSIEQPTVSEVLAAAESPATAVLNEFRAFASEVRQQLSAQSEELVAQDKILTQQKLRVDELLKSPMKPWKLAISGHSPLAATEKQVLQELQAAFTNTSPGTGIMLPGMLDEESDCEEV